MNDVRWTLGGRRGGAVPNYKYRRNIPESEFLTVQAEYSQSCKRLGSCLEIESVIECGPLPPTSTSHPPDIIHVICVPRPSLFFVLFQTEERKWEGLGARLTKPYVVGEAN